MSRSLLILAAFVGLLLSLGRWMRGMRDRREPDEFDRWVRGRRA